MTINTGIPSSIRRPQTFHNLIFQLGGRGLVPLPLRVALVGMKSSAGTATAEQVVAVNDAGEIDGLFGIGSELNLMCREAFKTQAQLGKGPALFAVPLAEPGAGVATQETLTVTGPATASGNLKIRIAGRLIIVGVAAGDVANTVAAAIESAIDAASPDLPLTAAVATNVVTTTHRTKGENGNDVSFVVEQTVAGVAVALAQSVAGTGVTDITNALDALAGQDYDGIAIANHKAADITDIMASINATWSATAKRWRWVFFGEPGSVGTATALGGAANHQGVLGINYEGARSLPGEMATAAACGAFSRERPNANYDGLALPLYPPLASLVFTDAEIETALAGGITPLSPRVNSADRSIIDGQMVIERLVTTKTTENSLVFEPLRDLAISRTGVYIARQIDISYKSKFGATALPDGALLDDNTIRRIRDMVAAILFAAQDLNILQNVETHLPLLLVERDPIAIGRVNVDITYQPVGPLHQAAFNHRVTL